MAATTKKTTSGNTKTEEKFDVVLKAKGVAVLQLVKEVKEIMNLSIGDAKSIVDNPPAVIVSGVSKTTAVRMSKKLEDTGAKVAIVATKNTTTVKKTTSKDVLAKLKEKFDEVYDDNGVYSVKSNGKWGFADANGVVKIKPCFTGIDEEWIEDIITTWGPGGVGFVNKKLEEIAKPQFGGATPFQNGISAVKQKSSGKWGVIDKNGKTVVPFVFDSLERLHNGKYEVKIGPLTLISK